MKQNKKQKKEVIDIDECISDSMCHLAKKSESKKYLAGIPSGFVQLDSVTGGFQGGELITIAGRPSMGKTSLALSMARNMAMEKHTPVLFATYEMNQEAVVNRLLAAECEIPLSEINRACLNHEEWDVIDKKVKKLSAAPIIIGDLIYHNAKMVLDMCRENVEKHRIKAVFIDSLQHICMENIDRDFSIEKSRLAPMFKALARELDIPVFITSTLRGPKEGDSYSGYRPKLSDLPDEGYMENFSDKVFLVHRPEEYHIYQDNSGRDLHGVANIIIAKNAGGRTGEIMLDFKGESGKFDEPRHLHILNDGPIIGEEALYDNETPER